MELFSRSLQKNMKPGASRALLIALSFLLPFVVITVALAGLKIAPFGDKTLVISDANGYYINTLSYAGRMFKGLEGITYSFEKGLGGNMMGHLNGILLTPFSFLFSFFSVSDYPVAMALVSTLSLSLCGLTMYLLLAELFGHKRSNLIFSTSYALIGFNVANVFQACFFMAAPVLPIMILGLRRILQGRNPLIYILSIAYAMLTSAYFGFVLCVASVLFFFTGLWLKKEELEGKRLRVFLHYALSSLCGGLLAAALWIPAFLSLQGGRLDQTGLSDFSFWENMPFLEIGAKLFTGANSTDELVNGLPNIFVGILPLALAVLFFLNKEIDKRKKAAAAFLLGVYLLSFWIVAVNMLMHGGTRTNWFNYRYSYVFSFLLLLLAAELWQKLDSVPYSDMKRCLVLLLLTAAVVFTKKYEFVKGGAVVLDFAILLLVFLAYRMHRKRPEVNKKSLFEAIALILVCVNLFLNYQICTKNIMDWSIQLSDYRKTVEQVEPLVKALCVPERGFFRMEVNKQRSGTCGNDPMLYGYNGVGHGGSNERNFVREGLNKLGVPWFDMRNYYADGIPAATDALLGIRYVIAAEDLAEEKGYQNVTNFAQVQLFGEQDEYTDIYYNPDALSVAILSGNGIFGVDTERENVFENLNAVWAAVSGEDIPVFLPEDEIVFTAHNFADPSSLTAEEAREIVAKYETQSSESDSASSSASHEIGVGDPPETGSYIEYRFTAARDGAVYAYNRGGLSDQNGSTSPVLTFVGNYSAGEEVVGYIPVAKDYVDRIVMEELSGRFRAAYADADALHALCEKVNARPVTIEKQSEAHLTGTFTSDGTQTLLLTIPYDAGWSCYVDGEKAELREALGVFMAVDAPEGTHTYELRYVPNGLRVGLLVSAAALVILLAYLLFGKKLIDRGIGNREPENGSEQKTDMAPLEDAAGDREEMQNTGGKDSAADNRLTTEMRGIEDLPRTKREHGLDFIKILATLMIVLHHYQQVHGVYFQQGINFCFGKFYFGYLVELFFVISGYLMYRYIARIQEGLKFIGFFLKRYLRFLPLMLLSVVCSVLLMYLFQKAYLSPWDGIPLGEWHIVLPAFGVQAWVSSTHQCVNNPLWYINVLLLCYVVMYLAVRAARKLRIPACTLFGLIAVLGAVGLLCGVDVPILNLKTERGFYAFFWGLILADALQRRRPSRILSGICAAVVIGFPILYAIIGNRLQEYIVFFLTFIYYSAVVVVFTSDLANRVFRNHLWERLADIAYNVYVWHSPFFILAALFFFAVRWIPDFSSAATVVFFVIVICLFSAGIYYSVDRPSRRGVDALLKRAERKGAKE